MDLYLPVAVLNPNFTIRLFCAIVRQSDSHMYRYIKKSLIRFGSWMNYNPPSALSSEGWRLFRNEFKKHAPIRYYLSKVSKNISHRYIDRPYNHIVDWIVYRTSQRYHIVNTGLTPGYYDADTIMLNANFSILVSHVERGGRSMSTPTFFSRFRIYRMFFPCRSREYGIRNLEWQTTLDDPSLPPHERSPEQAANARKVLELYRWWTETRPNRKFFDIPDFNDQGLGDLGLFNPKFNKNAPDYRKYIKISNKNSKLQEKWEKEDQSMLIKLVKMRSSLWS